MHRFGVPAFVAILFGIFAGCSFAQKAADNQDLTADELAVNASSRYAQGNYAEAANYRKFVADFGSALEAQAAVRQMRYPLACARCTVFSCLPISRRKGRCQSAALGRPAGRRRTTMAIHNFSTCALGIGIRPCS